MESEAEADQSGSTVKLSLFSLPISKPREPPEMQSPPSPPLQTLASIPFQWEEVPGKPRPTAAAAPPAKSKSLELPPRLLSESVKMTNMPSPTNVLEGPYVKRSGFRTLSFSSPKLGSFRSPGPAGPDDHQGLRHRKRESSRLYSSSSKRWGSLKGMNKGDSEGSFDFSTTSSSSSSVFSGGFDDKKESNKVKMSAVRRSRSLFSFSGATSNLLEAIVRAISKRSL